MSVIYQPLMIGRLELLSVKKGEDTILFILMSFHELSLKISLCGYLLLVNKDKLTKEFSSNFQSKKLMKLYLQIRAVSLSSIGLYM